MPDYDRLLRSLVSKHMTAAQRTAVYNDLRFRVQSDHNNQTMQEKISASLDLNYAIERHATEAALRDARYALSPTAKQRELRFFLSREKTHDLITLCENEFVEIQAFGNNIATLDLKLINLTDAPFNVVVRPGTTFLANGNYQNMAVRNACGFILKANEQSRCRLEVSCVDASLPIPTSNSGFTSVTMINTDAFDFIERAEGEDAMTVQAGIWAICSELSRGEIKRRLQVPQSNGKLKSGISDANLDRAAAILNEIGLKHRLGRSWFSRAWRSLR